MKSNCFAFFPSTNASHKHKLFIILGLLVMDCTSANNWSFPLETCPLICYTQFDRLLDRDLFGDALLDMDLAFPLGDGISFLTGDGDKEDFFSSFA